MFPFSDVLFKITKERQICDCFCDTKALGCPAIIYLFQANIRNTRKRCEICLKLTIKTPERRHKVVLVFLLLTIDVFQTFLGALASACFRFLKKIKQNNSVLMSAFNCRRFFY